MTTLAAIWLVAALIFVASIGLAAKRKMPR
jgi:hypothetical protein